MAHCLVKPILNLPHLMPSVLLYPQTWRFFGLITLICPRRCMLGSAPDRTVTSHFPTKSLGPGRDAFFQLCQLSCFSCSVKSSPKKRWWAALESNQRNQVKPNKQRRAYLLTPNGQGNQSAPPFIISAPKRKRHRPRVSTRFRAFANLLSRRLAVHL
jgi:hypothetical protein